jgi:hypothetical protein
MAHKQYAEEQWRDKLTLWRDVLSAFTVFNR